MKNQREKLVSSRQALVEKCQFPSKVRRRIKNSPKVKEWELTAAETFRPRGLSAEDDETRDFTYLKLFGNPVHFNASVAHLDLARRFRIRETQRPEAEESSCCCC